MITMKRKRITLEKQQEKEILNQRELRVTKEGNEYFFEIGPEMTSDVAEAVSILMRKVDWNDPIWNTAIDKKIEEITAKVADAQRVADAANDKAVASVVAQEQAQTAAIASTQQAVVQATEAVAVRTESVAKSAVATKAAADAALSAKVATAAVAAAAKVPTKAVIAPKPSTPTKPNSAKATITGLKPGQKVKVTVNVKGK